MFQYPATEIYNSAGGRRVVWSAEEFDGALADGWLEAKPEPTIEPAPELIAEPVEAPAPVEPEPPAPKKARK